MLARRLLVESAWQHSRSPRHNATLATRQRTAFTGVGRPRRVMGATGTARRRRSCNWATSLEPTQRSLRELFTARRDHASTHQALPTDPTHGEVEWFHQTCESAYGLSTFDLRELVTGSTASMSHAEEHRSALCVSRDDSILAIGVYETELLVLGLSFGLQFGPDFVPDLDGISAPGRSFTGLSLPRVGFDSADA